MPDHPPFAKCSCENCGGHLEYPSELGGTTVDCPHCRFPTPLPPVIPVQAPSRQPGQSKTALFKAAGLLIAVAAIAYGAWTVNNNRAASPLPAPGPPLPATANNPSTNKSSKPLPPPPPQWNGLEGAGPVALEKAEGKLVYAVGVLRNTTGKQKFALKVQLDLFDAKGAKIGSASDYTDTLAAGKEWHFRALVLDGRATTAKIKDVSED